MLLIIYRDKYPKKLRCYLNNISIKQLQLSIFKSSNIVIQILITWFPTCITVEEFWEVTVIEFWEVRDIEFWEVVWKKITVAINPILLKIWDWVNENVNVDQYMHTGALKVLTI